MADIITNLHPDGDENTNLYPNIKKENIPSKSISTDKLDDNVLSLIGSLKPSGTDTSTNILAFTSNKGIYVATDNGHWYYWNGVKYVDGGIYQSSEDVNNIKLYLDSLNNVIGAKNIVDNLPKIGSYYTSDGNLNNSNSWETFKCDITEYSILKLKLYTNNTTFYAIALYSSFDTFNSETFISGVKFNNETTIIDGFEIPTNAKCALIFNRKDTSTDIEILAQQVNYCEKLIAQQVNYYEKLFPTTKKAPIEYGSFYQKTDGQLVDSPSWKTYIESVNITRATISVYTNDTSGVNAISFYRGNNVTKDNYISGIKCNNIGLNTIYLSRNQIPQDATFMLICSRIASGVETNIEITTSFYDNVNILMNKLNEELYFNIGQPNIKAIYKNIPNSNDFTIIKDEIWFAMNKYENGVATEFSTIYRYKLTDYLKGELIKIGEIDSDFGHWNTVDYCEENDCLIFGNGANNFETEGNWFAIIKNPLALGNYARMSECAIKYNVNVGYKVQAIWGDNNLGKYNIVYLLSNNANTLTKVLLSKDNDGNFNGNYITLETSEIQANIGVGGCDYWGDTLYIGIGDRYRLALLSMTDYSIKEIEKKYYYDNGTLYNGSTQGVHIDDKYIWIFVNVAGVTENYLIQYYR